MDIKGIRVQNFKCIEDTGWVDFERITCFVGKNESGKTAFFQAISKLNPVNGEGDYDPLMEYPRRRLSRYQERHEYDPDPVTSLRFSIGEAQVNLIEDEYGAGAVESAEGEVKKDYQNRLQWFLDIDEETIVQNIISDWDVHPNTQSVLQSTTTIQELEEELEESDAESREVEQLRQQVNQILNTGIEDKIGNELLRSHLPQFLYFDEYSIMNGDVNIQNLIQRNNQGDLSRSDETFLSLLSLAGLEPSDLRNQSGMERRIAELEAASNRISDEVFEYWSQGPDLQVQFETGEVNDNSGPLFQVRVRNNRHRVSVPFDQRSSGFIWFFSFLAYFSDFQDSDSENIVLLLDEPGLNLHAKAQHDFLQFINDRLAPECPVAYTTHSPFMLEPKKLHRARLVIDNPQDGTKISSDILQSDEDTNFPLEAVLGYDLIQTLLIGPYCILVEGKSDMIYLQAMSEILEQRGRTALNHRWTIVPVGGADNVPTFISLFGASDLNIAVLLDDDSEIDQRLREIEARGVLDPDHVKTISNYIDMGEGDTEDLFDENFFCELVTDSYQLEFRRDAETPDRLSLDEMEFQHPRIVKRIERYFQRYHINEGEFHHTDPAKYLQKNREEFRSQIPESTINRFEVLFTDINGLVD